MKKIAFYGNSCTGKTSSLYGIAAYLTRQGKSFRIQNMPYDNSGHVKGTKPFDSHLLESTPEARAHFIFDQLANETRLETTDDVDFLLSEMTTLDLYHFYDWVCSLKMKKPNKNIKEICKDWLYSYDTIFVMSPTAKYFQDGSRYVGTKIRDALNPYYERNTLDLMNNSVPIDSAIIDRHKTVLEKFKDLHL